MTLVRRQSDDMIFESMIRYIVNSPKLLDECIENQLDIMSDLYSENELKEYREKLNNLCNEFKNTPNDINVSVNFLWDTDWNELKKGGE
tara:strand:- start:54 stop:320 length:267 start_codon:yes stop_codon:yes gene_type:complete